MIISAQALGKVYKGGRGHPGHKAVSDVSFDVAQGASLGIVGESGAGKTTLVSMIMGFETPTSGSILVDGQTRPVRPTRAEHKRWARRIQVVFQDPYGSLDPHQSAGDSIDEVLKFHFDLSRRQRATRTAQLLDAVGLSGDRANLLPQALSGGQRQRLAIAKALAVEPQVLILDEPVSALDVSVQAQVLNLLADLRRDLGLTYLFVSHDLGVIRFVTDDIIVMRHGVVVEQGRSADVLDRPSHPYTRMLLDAVPKPGWTPSAGRRPDAEIRGTGAVQP